MRNGKSLKTVSVSVGSFSSAMER
nr:unnamed protein product [Callosobruchus chinensis]